MGNIDYVGSSFGGFIIGVILFICLFSLLKNLKDEENILVKKFMILTGIFLGIIIAMDMVIIIYCCFRVISLIILT
jgi:hypothetical protein